MGDTGESGAAEPAPKKRRSELVVGILIVFALVVAGGIFIGPPEELEPDQATANRYIAETADLRDRIKRKFLQRFPESKDTLTTAFVKLDRWSLQPGSPRQQIDRSEAVINLIRSWVKIGGQNLAKLTVKDVLSGIDRLAIPDPTPPKKASEGGTEEDQATPPKKP